MSYILKKSIANKNNYGSRRSTTKIKYIVIHYTGNDGDHDESNGNYFKNNIVKASAHYFVDNDSVTQSVPDNYIAWSVGGSKYSNCSSTGGGKFHGKCTNTNSISIELCDTVRNGVVYPSKKTIANALELTKKLMTKYNIPKENVIRHFDVTGKSCPAYWCGTTSKNSKWKKEFHNKLSSASTGTKASSGTSSTSSRDKVKKAYSGAFPKLPSRGYFTVGDGSQTLKTYNGHVKRLQSFLNWCINAGLKVDGKYGEGTKEVVIKFQKKYGLTADGKFGAKSLAKAKTIKK